MIKKPNKSEMAKLMEEASIYLKAAKKKGWRVKAGRAEEPCRREHVCRGIQSCDQLGYHCYEHNEEIHCAHCCGGTLFTPI